MPRVSFIMTVKNGDQFIEKTLASVFAQTEKSLEIIVVNDHSTDDTVRILNSQKDQRLIILHLSDKTGIGAGRNAGAAIAKGDFILPIDADDINFPNRAKVSVEELTSNDADIFYGNVERFYVKSGKKELRHFQIYDPEMLRYINFIPNPASAYRKEVFEKIGSYAENFSIGEDYDFFLSAQESGFKFCCKNIPLAQYTMHKDQVTGSDNPAITQSRQELNRRIRQKHRIFNIDLNYVRDNASLEVVDFYIETNYDIWFAPESIPKDLKR